jgi:hypothetical protein
MTLFRPHSPAAPLAAAGALLLATATAPAQQRPAQDPRWAAVRQVFGQGEEDDGYLRINLPRTDLHVRIGGDALDPEFEFTSFIGFVPHGTGNVLAMGEIVLLQQEIPTVLAEARQQGIHVTALHNHLLNEEPRIMYAHVMAEGPADAVARRLRATFARTATPLTPPPKEVPPRGAWTSIDAVLGPHSEAHGSVAEYEFPRNEALRVHGVSVKSSGAIETGSEVVFQQLAGGRVASTGELYLLASEVEPVASALEANGLHVTALHNHMLDDGPAHFWVHWYTTGDGPTLARGIAAALEHVNGARTSKTEH